MAAKKQQSITTLPPSPEEERRSRMVGYSIAMGVRIVCLILAIVVPDWWKLIPILGAVVLPWIAVVVANVSMAPRTAAVERPGSYDQPGAIERYTP
jgi:predicted tellurium resistance membrane protein TerC